MMYIKGMFIGAGLALYIALVIALVIVGPFITIWALNTLFATGIAFTFKTLLATFVLQAIFVRLKFYQKKN